MILETEGLCARHGAVQALCAIDFSVAATGLVAATEANSGAKSM
jgi:hypothetical protein